MWGKRETDEVTYDYAFQAITCADAIDSGNTTTYDVFREILSASQNVSEMFGPSFGDAGFWCHKWPARAVERITGPWNSTAKKNKLLVIGNVADPITPFPGAQLVADVLLGEQSAVLIEQNDYGHTSLAEHSDCTLGIVHDFFVDGKYPTQDQFCGTNQILFPGGGVTKQSLANGGSLNPMYNPHVPIPRPPGSDVLLTENNNNNNNNNPSPTNNQNNQPSNSAMAQLQNQIDSLKDTRRTLYIALGSVALALLLSILALVIALCRRRKPSYSGLSSGGGGGGGGGGGVFSKRKVKPNASTYVPIGIDEKDIDGPEPRGIVHHHDDTSDAFTPPRERLSSERLSGERYTDPYDPPAGVVGGSSYSDGGRGYGGH